jgi:2-methylcitrate dehydratase PrpD
MGATKELVDFIVDTSFKDLPNEVIDHMKYCVLDWLGVALAGSMEPEIEGVTSFVRGMGGNQESTIIGTPFKTSCLNAALSNGIMGHLVELDDIHEESIIHPAAPVMPAALALSEREGLRGKDLLTAVALGYEVEIRLGMALNPSHYRFWHPTGTCGTFGATVAAGKLLNLNKGEMTNALGLAGTEAAGLVEVFGTTGKPLNAGRAAMDGLMAAMLAQKGFTGPESILEAERGYLHATSSEPNIEKITEDLGRRWEAMNNIFKLHASCGHTHGALDAVLEIVEREGIEAGEVDEVTVATYPIAAELVGKNYDPKTVSEAKFSLPYCVAASLIHGKVSLNEFSSEKLGDPEILKLGKRVKVLIDPEYVDVRLGSAKVNVRLKNGDEYNARIDVPSGYPRNPLTGLELKNKFKTLSSLSLPEERTREILESVMVLDTCLRK